ncbi:hypothetical protein FOZ60_001803 [Perkinsus olseni]|uniref:Uncharacterized protein n=1 Tax=Perkinsus olseni TaxID=32597 RepID=A0A7J6NZF7_PEROL|nr:hypothetical protein FOZ60_001803 [Perkinsus olseni]
MVSDGPSEPEGCYRTLNSLSDTAFYRANDDVHVHARLVRFPVSAEQQGEKIEVTLKNYPYGTSRRKCNQVAFKVTAAKPFTTCFHRDDYDIHSLVEDLRSCSEAIMESTSRRLSDSILARKRREEVSETTPRDNTDEGFGVEAHLRELRALIRPLGMISPQAASALEIVVKGILLNSDWAISDRNITIKRSSVTVRKRSMSFGEPCSAALIGRSIDLTVQTLNNIHSVRRGDGGIFMHMSSSTSIATFVSDDEGGAPVEQEKASLRQNIEELKLELAQLAPNSQDVDKVKSLMDDFSKLIAAFGDEGARHGRILEDFKVFAHKMASDTSTNIDAGRAEWISRLQSYKKGRLVQLQSGELLLRHYDSKDFTSQLWESELIQVDPRATPWLCPSYLRVLHYRYMWESLPPMNVRNLEELLLQIVADLPMLNGAPVQNPIPKFHDSIIDFTLAHSACLEEAELRLYTMLRSTLAYPFVPEDVLSLPPAVHLLRRLLRVSPLSMVIPYPIAAACLNCLKRSIQGDKTLQSVILENEEIEITELHPRDPRRLLACRGSGHPYASSKAMPTHRHLLATLRAALRRGGLREHHLIPAGDMILALQESGLFVGPLKNACELLSVRLSTTGSHLQSSVADDATAERLYVSSEKVLENFGPLGVVKHSPPVLPVEGSSSGLFVLLNCIAEVMTELYRKNLETVREQWGAVMAGRALPPSEDSPSKVVHASMHLPGSSPSMSSTIKILAILTMRVATRSW